MKRMIVGVAVSMAVACGGSSAPANSVNGTIHGQSVQTQNGVSAAVMINSGGVQAAFGEIFLSNDGNLCSDLAANKQPKNSQGFVLLVTDWNSTTKTFSVPVAAGDYQVTAGTGGAPPAKGAFTFYGQSDASCQTEKALGATGMSGVVHITSVNNGVFSGSFDIVVAEDDATGAATSTTDHWTGTFNPSLCAGLSAAFSTNNSTPPTCY